jgi:Ca-activated chloride channel family protein
MIHFQWWWMLAALPLPALVFYSLHPRSISFTGLKVPFYEVVANAAISHNRAQHLALGLAILAWLLLLLACMRPQWVGEPVSLPLSGRDLMLAVDLSESMKARDMQIGGRRVDRLQAVQAIAGDFITRREGDRLGLILFGSQAYLQSPLTLDRRTVSTLLNEAVIGMAGPRTAIGNAIALAVKRLQKRQGQEKVLILLTDGENTAGNISPEQAAQAAKSIGLKIYTIGIGSTSSGALAGFFSSRSGVDERGLKRIAETTGGRYFQARDTQELAQIYTLIDQLETVEEEVRSLRPVKELYYWPASLALLLACLLFWVRRRWIA